MGLERSGDILKDAYKNKYGVAAFNIFNYETIKCAVDAAEEIQKPVIIQFYPGWLGYISFEAVAEITKSLAVKSKIPIGLHLDHCGDIDMIISAIRAGFISVMYDGSRLPFDENIKRTKEVVDTAKAFNITVEAELGNIGSAANIADFTDRTKFTDPDDALEFFNKTGVSSLAIAVGNAHGNYAVLPDIDTERIKKINGMINIPLVLHGGSGIPDEQLKEAVKCGIAKINVATEYHHAYYKAVEEYTNGGNRKDMYSCVNSVQKKVKEFLINKIDLLN